MEKYSLLTKSAKCTLNIDIATVFHCRSKKGLKQCLGGLKCIRIQRKTRRR